MINIFELSLFLAGIKDDEYEDDYQLFDLIADKYGLEDMEKFNNLITDLIDLIEVGESPLTKKVYKGFASDRIWLAKTEIQHQHS